MIYVISPRTLLQYNQDTKNSRSVLKQDTEKLLMRWGGCL